jgi:hypothetical protein
MTGGKSQGFQCLACCGYPPGKCNACNILLERYLARDDRGDLGVASDNIKIKLMHFCDSIDRIKLAWDRY